ncbi:MAG: TonB-dependent receptor [Candidatus Marinimicrobia bacterium]|nr:TonB-dependent receptor [Candidatus Neomarinimicrobiota bacterium]MBT5995565.1 TonB-dependent receptor [Candidatus Neomarinimicrobiota bacterium]MBT6943273.1 TonB-dependent receptor [Candidatus Neomarinimicrobiota bacterium]
MHIAKKFFTIYTLLLTFIVGQVQTITGYVIDGRTNQPIIGANILVVGTESGSSSDEAGKFSIKWSGVFPIKVKITHIAYEALEQSINNSGTYSFRLNPTVLKGQEVNITGSRGEAEKDISSAVEIVTVRKAEIRGIRDISEVLREMEGVTIATSTTGEQRVSIRGSNPNEVSVYLDGIKMNRSLDNEANLALIDLTDLEHVEVVRGGASTLFGAGNFGGVVLMRSNKLDHNYFQVLRSIGITNKSDQDLSGAVSVKAGPMSLGGRFSGKSRLYDGRTLYTTLFENFATEIETEKLAGTVRFIQQENTIEFKSGGIRSADKMDSHQFRLKGDLPYFKGFDLQWGRRNWYWNDQFFTNVSRILEDSSSTMRLSKSFEWKNLNGTIQVEEDRQYFAGNQIFTDSYSSRNWTDVAELRQRDRGWAGVLRFDQKNPVSDIDFVRFELGTRSSKSIYDHDQEIMVYDSTVFKERILYNIQENTPLKTYRLGISAEGRMATGNKFSLFFNQGSNHRTPTLNDRFLWGIGLDQLQDYYTRLQRTQPSHPEAQAVHELKIQDVKQILALMMGGLKREYVTTTELSAKLKADQLNTSVFTSMEVGLGIFRNSYLDKVAYRVIPGELLAPFNTTTAWMNGLEVSAKSYAWDNSFQMGLNMMWLSPSDANVFPDKPSSRSNFIADYRKGWVHINLSHIKQGPQKYMRGGVLLNQDEVISNTNVTVSLNKRFWLLDFTLSYAVRNLFSNTAVIVDANNISPDGSFNYYDAHRRLLSFKINLAESK